ncbi:AAA domain-containing protein [Multifurca ochricompacta]|uniref:AAA domain-containing protein n=1 Tax=Multifurca ochricompacta TaxID=376703 RepID=A0AAD4LTZ5_9AGAM|nr:AAA domain-containing protein [Multifurca ochricompacta]
MFSISSSGRRGCAGAGSIGRGGRGRGNAIPNAIPRGVCKFYWSTGACDRGFECTFKHEAKLQAVDPLSAKQLEDYALDFFSLEELAMNNGSIVDSQHTLRPSEAHNHLKQYLMDNFVFRGAMNVEGFSRIFASVSPRNKAWDSNQAQAFLDAIVRGNALLRIGDVLRYSPVAVNTSAGSLTLSYQKGYFPILEFLSSDLVLKTTMHQNTNKIYSLIDQNYDEFQSTIRTCMASMINAGTWEDLSPASRRNTLDGLIVFKTLSTILLQYFSRFKRAIQNHPDLRDFVADLCSWWDRWETGVMESPPTFKDPITSSEVRYLTLAELRKDINRLKLIVDREYGHTERMRRPVVHAKVTIGQMHQAQASRLEHTYDPPGTLRDGGQSRHDNDFTDIRDIRIGPTHEELLCPLGPYLPVFLQTAPHHLPEHSMQRHLDIQFRLLREEMISSIRQSVGEICRDLDIMWAPRTRSKQHATLLEKLLSTKGGAYKTSGKSSVFFHLYTGARFAPLKAEYRNFTVGLLLDAPPGGARDQIGKRRAEYWEHSKRLQHGSIIVLVLISPGQAEVFLGTIASKGADIGEYAKADANTIQLRIAFFDAKIELMALRRQPISVNASTYAVLLDNSIMFESLHPFLKTLQNVEPTSIPFSNLISYSGPLGKIPVELPRYARVPCFRYNLQCLARPGQNISDLDVNNPTAVRLARENLKRSCNLDPSQVDALLDTLTREVSLIQGPPGTGKSFTGKEILRVLFSSKIKPIGPSNYARDTSSHSPSVVIAFTNHALDHLLTSVLDSGMTTKVVRLGSRSTDERIEQYSLHKLEQLSGRGDLDRPMRREYAVMKKVEEDMTRIMNKIQLPRLTWDDAEIFLEFHYPQHADSFKEPPYWISKLFRQVIEDENENGEWTHVSNKKNTTSDLEIVGIYEFWKSGQDVAFIQPRSNPVEPGGKKGADPREAFFNELGFSGQIPSVPSGNRSLKHLTEGVHNVWLMSLQERKRIARSWEDDMRKIAYDSNLTEFDTLRLRYKDACMVYEDVRDEFRRRLLSRTDLIACTTTGGAKLVSLLTSIGPKVLMVEEAGQVLEAHILASLSSI